MAEQGSIWLLSLVIDDDPRLGAMLWRSPGLARHQVQVAGDGEAGLKAALAKDSDLVILDWMLPGMNGIEALITPATADLR
jgi:two-component system phosphate regulon response regulator PhoB